jgi:hypothetical protein
MARRAVKQKTPKRRNHIARACSLVNFPKSIPAKKGKGSFRRMKGI